MNVNYVVMGSKDMTQWVAMAEFADYEDALEHLTKVVTFQYWKIETIWSFPF